MNPISMLLRPGGATEDAFSDAPTAIQSADTKPSAIQRLLAKPELILLLVATAALFLWGLSKNGMANEYYSATVRSMAANWHNFFYGSFDINGIMTVDKPPLAFWVQTLSVKVFGFSSWSLLVPQALMGVAAVGLTYDIVGRRFGRWPAFAAGSVLALTPMTVAISRHNNPDALLILLSVAAVWLVLRALEDGRTKWLALAGAAVGAAFTTKMGAALLVLPGPFLAYMWAAPVKRSRAFTQLLIGGGVMIAVAAAWPLLMALTPASSRPWISGTTDNSIWSLITQYNGLGRLNGQSGGPGGMGGGVFGGSTGIARLFNSALGPQVSWLLGFAIVGGLAVAFFSKLRPSDDRTGWIIAVGGTFATIAVAFSFAKGIFHPYYSSQLAPFTAMLVGGGIGAFTRDERKGPSDQVRRYWTAGALVAGLGSTLWVLNNATADKLGAWQVPLALIVLSAAAAIAVAGQDRKLRDAAMIAAVMALLVAPAIWSAQTLGHATSSTFPAGGSAAAASSMGGPGGGGPGGAGGTRGGFGGPPPGASTQSGARPTGAPAAMGGGGPGGAGGMFGGGNSQQLTSAIAYAKANGGGTIGVESQMSASSVISNSGANVAGIGGFSGRESTVSLAWLAQAVRDGRLSYFITGGNTQGMGNDGRAGSTAAMAAVAKVCRSVTLDSATASTTNTTTTTTATTTNSSTTSSGFYDCTGKAAALKALAS
jgi:4-amino-4-deoxy-L-arabinose transferase-like glycosyltransferase